MFVQKGISAVRVDLTNVIAELDQKDDIVVILDRGKPVAAIVPFKLAHAVNVAATATGEGNTDPVEYAMAVLESDAAQNAPVE